MIKFFDYSFEYNYLKKEIFFNIQKVLKSGQLILGSEVKNFENNFSKIIGKKFGVGVNSGTDALILALRALSLPENSEIITVANTTVPTIAAIRAANLKPVFVDIKQQNFQIDENKIEEKINTNTRALLIVHLYGIPAPMTAIAAIAKKYNLKLIEDCAQSFGSGFSKKLTGSFADISCFSFYPTKNLGAYGDGGMCVTSNKKYYEKLKLLRFYGYKNNNPISVIEGYNSRLDEMQAAILNTKLKYFDFFSKKKKQICKFYFENIFNNKIQLPPNIDNALLHLFVIKTNTRNKLINHLKKYGIETKIHYPVPIHLMPAYKFLNYQKDDLPVTEQISKQILSLPLHYGLTKSQLNTIVKTLNQF